jgi:hypothetical protein
MVDAFLYAARRFSFINSTKERWGMSSHKVGEIFLVFTCFELLPVFVKSVEL